MQAVPANHLIIIQTYSLISNAYLKWIIWNKCLASLSNTAFNIRHLFHFQNAFHLYSFKRHFKIQTSDLIRYIVLSKQYWYTKSKEIRLFSLFQIGVFVLRFNTICRKTYTNFWLKVMSSTFCQRFWCHINCIWIVWISNVWLQWKGVQY
jgi:hypothetical protein